MAALALDVQAKVASDEGARVRQAARTTTSPAILDILARDAASTVRAAVALNPTFAATADTHLVQAPDERVRALLATQMARLLPSLSTHDQAAAQAHVHAMLRCLAKDTAVRVREAIAVALTKLTEAPHDVILGLAHDPSIAVSDPILRFSPLLTDADLVGLLATPPHNRTALAVASRFCLSAEITDIIAQHADSAAVTVLLSNRSATIQEATLDALISRAAEHPEWHGPLVHRPALPGRSIRALSLIVARHMLEILINRADIPIDLAIELRGHVAQSLVQPKLLTEAEILERVRRLNTEGLLNEAALLEAASSGDARQAAAILAVASGVTLQLLDRAVALRSAKALVSLVHRAGFSMDAGMVVQNLLGRLTPGERLCPSSDGSFPLSVAEMVWQIDLLSQPAR